jgi:hypothetical protein
MNDPFGPSSRYRDVPLRTRKRADGSDETFVGRRIIPGPERYRALDRVRMDGQIRIDAVAAAAFGDSLLYWRICDANGEAEPADATQPAGHLLVIPLPLEIDGNADA